jgi:hypothetical protein
MSNCWEKSVVPDVTRDQIWEIHTDTVWRRAQVINVLGNDVELKYLDMPEVSDLARSFRADRVRMLNEPNRYRIIISAP